MEVLGMCLPCVKRYFQLVQGNFFSLGLKLLRFSSFWACWFGSNQKSQFNNNSFSKIFCYGSFRYVLLTPVNFFSFGLKLLILLFLGVAVWERSKVKVQQQLFLKAFMYVSALCKQVFSASQEELFFFRTLITQILFFLNMLVWEQSNASLTMIPFQTFSVMEILGVCLPYIKRFHHGHQ